MCFIPRFETFLDGHFCITLMPNIPSYAICLFLIKVLTLKVDIIGERCTCKFDNSESYFVWCKEWAQSSDNIPFEGLPWNHLVLSMT